MTPSESFQPSRNAKQIPLDTGIDETMEDHAHEEPSNAQLLRRHDSLERLHTQLQSDFAGQRRTTASCFVEIETLRKRIEEQDEQIATLRGEFASLKNYNIAIIRQREAS
ncbi:hypothetical protein BDV97DRAFT_401673 [Delphinella strobiligena]|nr:hypothetical protein BDV97DRAFT_401673 [Delphinella strobiligena]